MKTFIAAGLIVSTLLLGTQAGFARNLHMLTTQSHHGSGTPLALGDLTADCVEGQATADIRTIQVNNHNQVVVHLQAQSISAAFSLVEGLDCQRVLALAPINFLIAKGNGAQFLAVGVQYLPEGSSTPITVGFVTPDSKIFNEVQPGPAELLIDHGNGNYSVPLSHNGGPGIPQGSQIVQIQFLQGANESNCNVKTSDINHVNINGRFIGIDTTSAAASCGSDCGQGG